MWVAGRLRQHYRYMHRSACTYAYIAGVGFHYTLAVRRADTTGSQEPPGTHGFNVGVSRCKAGITRWQSSAQTAAVASSSLQARSRVDHFDALAQFPMLGHLQVVQVQEGAGRRVQTGFTPGEVPPRSGWGECLDMPYLYTWLLRIAKCNWQPN